MKIYTGTPAINVPVIKLPEPRPTLGTEVPQPPAWINDVGPKLGQNLNVKV